MNRNLAVSIAALGTALAFATPASALVQTFASFSAVSSANNFAFSNSGNGAGRAEDAKFYSTSNSTIKTTTSHHVTTTSIKSLGTPGAVDVRLTFLQTAFTSQPLVQNITAALTATGTIAKNSQFLTQNVFGHTLFSQTGFSGTFTFLSKSAIAEGPPNFVPHLYPVGSVLLKVVFANATLGGEIGSSSGGADYSTLSGGTITFSSDFLDFTPTIERDLGLTFTSVFPTFSSFAGSSNKALKSFLTNGGGQFSSDPAPIVNGLAIVPEPAMWGLLVVGFGMVGLQNRRRTRAASVTA